MDSNQYETVGNEVSVPTTYIIKENQPHSAEVVYCPYDNFLEDEACTSPSLVIDQIYGNTSEIYETLTP